MVRYTRSDLLLDPRIVGFAQGLCPFVANTSAGRNKMFSKHLDQALMVNGADFAQIFTGKEFELGQYEMSSYESKYDRRVLAVIPRYAVLQGQFHIKESPSVTVIYAIDDTREVGYFDLDTYTTGSNGFGYENTRMNYRALEKGSFIPRDMKFQTSPIHKGNKYCYGLNGNVALMTHPDTVEDAMVVSESFAKKLQTNTVATIVINVNEDQYPLNLYGDDTVHRFFPDIGETVREDGYLSVLRTSDMYTIISDTNGSSIYTPRMQDEQFIVPPGARVLDVEVNLGRSNKLSQPMFAQAEHYADLSKLYYRKVYKAYVEHCKKMDYTPTPAFNTKVTTAMKRLIVAGDRIPNVESRARLSLADNDHPIRFMQIKLTYIAPRSEAPVGFKITDNYGGNKYTILA